MLLLVPLALLAVELLLELLLVALVAGSLLVGAAGVLFESPCGVGVVDVGGGGGA